MSTTTTKTETETSPVKFLVRPSTERGNANHGWLKSFHTFSFADYFDAEHTEFGSLRVINEDRVEPHTGFGTHGHREFEIFSYIVSGELQHNDSMGNKEVLRRGDLQMTSTGTGIRHSEMAHGPHPVHFLQIWAKPAAPRLPPAYYTRHFPDADKLRAWVRVVAPAGAPDVALEREADGPAPVHAPVSLFATILEAGVKRPQVLAARMAYVHVIQTAGYNAEEARGAAVSVAGAGAGEVVLREGDGLYVVAEPGQELAVANVGDEKAEVLLFEIEQ